MNTATNKSIHTKVYEEDKLRNTLLNTTLSNTAISYAVALGLTTALNLRVSLPMSFSNKGLGGFLQQEGINLRQPNLSTTEQGLVSEKLDKINYIAPVDPNLVLDYFGKIHMYREDMYAGRFNIDNATSVIELFGISDYFTPEERKIISRNTKEILELVKEVKDVAQS